MKVAAIDIGSNAVRLYIANVYDKNGEQRHKKSSLVRVPIRLGADVFGPKKEISDHNEERLVKTMFAYRNLMEVHGVQKYRACATSAFREAKNGEEVIKSIYKQTGILIELISGSEEAQIIYSNQIERLLDKNSNALYVDVGGGSTEISLFKGKEVVDSKSFEIGTVRLIQRSEDVNTWIQIKDWLETAMTKCKADFIIGSGGNINKLVKLKIERSKDIEKEISYSELKDLKKEILSLTYEERISQLDLNPDRADVIVPASKIFIAIMEWSRVDKVIVPKIGLSDGIATELYKNPNFPYQKI